MATSDLLLHFNGPDGSTVFTDSGKHALAVSVNGSVAISNAIKKFGSGSAYFGGGANRLTIPAGSHFNLGSGDFTINAQVYPTAWSGDQQAVLCQSANLSDNGNRSFGLTVQKNYINLYYTTNGVSDNTISFFYSLPLNAWSGIELSRVGSTLYCFVDGALVGSQPFTATIYSSTAPMCIGTFGRYAEDGYGFLSFNGYIDEVRILKGTGSHTASFPPETGEYEMFVYLATIATAQAQSASLSALRVYLATIASSQSQEARAEALLTYLAAISTSQAQSAVGEALYSEFSAHIAIGQAQSASAIATSLFIASMATSQGQSAFAVGELSFSAVIATGQAQSVAAAAVGVTLARASTSQAQAAAGRALLYLADPSRLASMRKSVVNAPRRPTEWMVPKNGAKSTRRS